jgi:hypothetical protein
VYYSYMDIKSVRDNTNFPAFFTVTSDLDIVVSYSDDDGATWAGPVLALNGDPYTVRFSPCPSPPFPPGSYCGTLIEPGYAFDKNWIGVHSDASQSNRVYVTATRFDTPGSSHIAFTASSNAALSWAPHQLLDTGGLALVQGSRPTGGLGGDVLVAWYHSGTDGVREGRFQIRVARSTNRGVNFGPPVVAADDSYELPFWLGPFTMHKRWWGAMFPDVEIDARGTAHIVYTHDPEANGVCVIPFPPPTGPVAVGNCSTTAEDGDIRYISSAGPPYTTWTARVTVNDDGLTRAQGYAALQVLHGQVQVIWEDSRLGPNVPVTPADAATCLMGQGSCATPNVLYDIFHARKVPGGGWMPNFRVTESSSIQDFIFTGDYTDLAANQTTLFGVWPDRRHLNSVFLPNGQGVRQPDYLRRRYDQQIRGRPRRRQNDIRRRN